MNLDALKTLALGAVGTVFVIWMAVKVFTSWGKSEYGRMVGEVLAGVVVAAFCFFPDQSITFIKDLADQII